MGGDWRGLAVSQHAFRATNSEIEAKLAETQRLYLIRHGRTVLCIQLRV